MSEAFEGYEKQYCELSISLSRKCSSAALLPDGVEKIQDISGIKVGIDDADMLIRKMDLEARSLMPNSKAMLLAKLREYKADLNKLKREFKQLTSENSNHSCAVLLDVENMDTHEVSANHRDKLMMSTERLDQSTDRIIEARRAALETEQHGVLILEELHGQRETLLHAHTKMAKSSSRNKSSKKRKQETPILAPVIATRPLTVEEKAVSFDQTASNAAKRAYNKVFGKCSVRLERGMDFTTLGKKVKEIFENRGWLNIAHSRDEPVNATIVAEFYSVLSTRNEEDGPLTSVTLRTVRVPFSPLLINAVYGIPEVPDENDYYAVWNLNDPAALETKALEAQHAFDPEAVWIDNRFKYGGCLRDIRAIKRFLAHTIYPSVNVTSYGKTDVCIAWAMVKDVPINLGKIIFKRAVEFANNSKVGGHMPFPNLISTLCTMVKVPVLPADRIIPSDVSMIGPRLTALPSGPIDYNDPNRQPPQPQPPRTRPPPLFSSARQSQQAQGTDTQPDTNTQAILQALARNDANLALGFERARQWNNDLRVGLRAQRAFLRNLKPEYAAISDILPECQADPYTLPAWIPPIPPPTIFNPHTQSSTTETSMPGGLFAGTSDFVSSVGGFTSVADVTVGLSSYGLDSSVRMTTTQSQVPFHTTASTIPFSDTTQFTTQGAEFMSSAHFEAVSTQIMPGSSYDVKIDIDEEE